MAIGTSRDRWEEYMFDRVGQPLADAIVYKAKGKTIAKVWDENRERFKKICQKKAGVDDAAVIQRAIDTVQANGGGVVKLSSSRFYITDTILIKEKIRLVGTSSYGAYAPNVAVEARGSSTELISKTDNPVIRIYNPDREAEGIDLVCFAILPDEYGSRGDAIYLDTRSHDVRQIRFEGLEIREMGGYGINKASVGNAYGIIIRNCGFTRNRLGNVKVYGGADTLYVSDSWFHSFSGTWNIETRLLYMRGGVCGGYGNGIKFVWGSVIGVDGEGGKYSGTIGILIKGTLMAYIIGGEWYNWGTCIMIGETSTDNARAFICTQTRNAVDGAEVVLNARGGLTRVILLDIGTGTFQNNGYPCHVLDLRFDIKKPFRIGRIQYLDTDVGLGNEGALFYEYYTNALMMDNGVALIPLGFAPEIYARFHDHFIGAGLSGVWSVGAGTVNTVDSELGGVVRLTTGAIAGDAAVLNHGGIRTILLSTGTFDITAGGFSVRFKLGQTTAFTMFIGLRTDANNYTGIFADPSVSNNFLVRVNSGGTVTDYDTGVAIDTSWHTFAFFFMGGNMDAYLDGIKVVDGKSTHLGYSEPYIEIITKEDVAKSVDIDYIDVWRAK